jgi:hypothetical protein
MPQLRGNEPILGLNTHEERALSYIHESLEEFHNYRSTILSNYSFKSSTHILDKISYKNFHDLLL